MNPLHITTLQTDLFWEDPQKNLQHLSEHIEQMAASTDILVLPEMFTTGFSMHPETQAEAHGGPGLQWMQQTALKHNCVVTGSIAVKDEDRFYNRLYWVMPDGHYTHYNKRHLFSMGKEHEHYAPGTEKQIVQYKGWNILPLICYDLRFPVWSRNSWNKETATAAYDLLIYCANWPEVRSFPWRQLLIARAIENQAYVVGVNRVGKDGQGIVHVGDTLVLNPRGETLYHAAPHEEACTLTVLDNDYLLEFRKQFPAGADADNFQLL